MRRLPPAAALAAALAAGPSAAAPAPSSPVPAAGDLPAVRRFVERHCLDCHSGDSVRGGVDLEAALNGELAADQVTWGQAVDQVRAGEMPPKKKARPPAADRDAFLAAVDLGLTRAADDRAKVDGRVPARKLTPAEYEHTLRDLLHLPHLHVKHLLPDTSNRGFFDQSFANRSDKQSVSPAEVEAYAAAADLALELATVLGPRPEPRKFVLNPYAGYPTTGKDFVPVGDMLYVFHTGKRMPFHDDPKGLRFQNLFPGEYKFRFKAWSTCYDQREKLFMPLLGSFYRPRADGGMHYVGMSSETKTGVGIPLGTYDIPPNAAAKTEEGTWHLGHDVLKLNLLTMNETDHKDSGTGVMIEELVLEGPVVGPWPPASYRALYGDLPSDFKQAVPGGLSKGPTPDRRYLRGDLPNMHERCVWDYCVIPGKDKYRDARRLLEAFMTRAFRRPVTAPEFAPFWALVKPGLDARLPFQEALRPGYVAVLTSPEFLFLHERPGRLDGRALANRLSYFLWRSMPDDELLQAGTAGRLSDPAELDRQVTRMLADPKSDRFVDGFLGEWLSLDAVEEKAAGSDTWLRQSMRQEAHAFFRELLDKDLPVANLIDSDFAVLNHRLANHYGVPGVTGGHFRRVKLPAGSPRGGLLTQAGVLNVSTDGQNSNPILRGAWVARKVLGVTIPPPPPLPPKKELPPGARPKTLREEVAAHSQVASCRDCHRKFDGLGFALEGFDAAGAARQFYPNDDPKTGKPVKGDYWGTEYTYHVGDRPVETHGTTVDGKRFADVRGLKKLLMADLGGVERHLIGRLLAYATGGEIQYADRRAVDAIHAALAKPATLGAVVRGVVKSRTFQEK